MLVQQSLAENPFDGSVYAFRGRRSGLIKLIWHDGIGLCMLTSGSSKANSTGPRSARPVGSHYHRRSWRRCSKGASGVPPRAAAPELAG